MSRLSGGAYERTGKARPGFWQPPLYRLTEPLSFEVGWAGSGWLIVVPAGYEFDLSAPWWIRWALPRDHLARVSAIHDYARHELEFDLWFGNLLLLDAERAAGVPEPTRTLVWLAVRTSTQRD